MPRGRAAGDVAGRRGSCHHDGDESWTSAFATVWQSLANSMSARSRSPRRTLGSQYRASSHMSSNGSPSTSCHFGCDPLTGLHLSAPPVGREHRDISVPGGFGWEPEDDRGPVADLLRLNDQGRLLESVSDRSSSGVLAGVYVSAQSDDLARAEPQQFSAEQDLSRVVRTVPEEETQILGILGLIATVWLIVVVYVMGQGLGNDFSQISSCLESPTAVSCP